MWPENFLDLNNSQVKPFKTIRTIVSVSHTIHNTYAYLRNETISHRHIYFTYWDVNNPGVKLRRWPWNRTPLDGFFWKKRLDFSGDCNSRLFLQISQGLNHNFTHMNFTTRISLCCFACVFIIQIICVYLNVASLNNSRLCRNMQMCSCLENMTTENTPLHV